MDTIGRWDGGSSLAVLIDWLNTAVCKRNFKIAQFLLPCSYINLMKSLPRQGYHNNINFRSLPQSTWGATVDKRDRLINTIIEL